MDSKPDSLLTAARRLAEIVGLPWSEVQPYYKALQESGGALNSPWLPKSFGRNIWYAHPHFIMRLLIALAAARDPRDAHAAIDWARETTPGGREKYLREKDAAGVTAPLEREFLRYMTDAETARDLESIEVQPDRRRVIFHTKSNGAEEWSRPAIPGEGRDAPPRRFQGIHHRAVIEGLVFVHLAQSVAWRMSDQPPFVSAKPGDPEEE